MYSGMKHDSRRFSLGANLLLPIAKINLTPPKYSERKKMFNKVHFFSPPVLSLKSCREVYGGIQPSVSNLIGDLALGSNEALNHSR